MVDVIVIGAGPAGLCAAIACAEHGLRVKVLDEFVRPGGRLLGQLHQEPDGEWWNGISEAKKLEDRAHSLGVEIEMGISVYDIVHCEEGWQVYAGSQVWQTPALLLATGAAEIASPIPGWTLPGVMSIGAAQVMTNVHRVPVGKRGIIVGINVLSMAIARELQLAGIEVAAMVLPAASMLNQQTGSPRHVMDAMLRLAHLAPSPLLRFGAKLMRNPAIKKLGHRFYPKRGMRIWGIPIQLRLAAVDVEGNGQVERVQIADVDADGQVKAGSIRSLDVDFVCISGGLYPLAELAAVAGCPFRYIPELGGHVPVHNEQMETPISGLYVAGNITGIESAKIALAQGTVAGLSIARQLLSKRIKPYTNTAPSTNADLAKLDHLLQTAMQKVHRVRSAAVLQFHPQVEAGRQQMTEHWLSTSNRSNQSS